MKTPRRALDIFDNLFHILWFAFGLVGAFTIPLNEEIRELWRVIAAGLVLGLATCPAVVRRLRPRLQRRFPWAFDIDPGPVRPASGSS